VGKSMEGFGGNTNPPLQRGSVFYRDVGLKRRKSKNPGENNNTIMQGGGKRGAFLTGDCRREDRISEGKKRAVLPVYARGEIVIIRFLRGNLPSPGRGKGGDSIAEKRKKNREIC